MNRGGKGGERKNQTIKIKWGSMGRFGLNHISAIRRGKEVKEKKWKIRKEKQSGGKSPRGG